MMIDTVRLCELWTSASDNVEIRLCASTDFEPMIPQVHEPWCMC